jgi:hypothetical protein
VVWQPSPRKLALQDFYRPAGLRPKIKVTKEVTCRPNDKVEKQIVKVFGSDCKMALAVSQAENGTRECARVSQPNSNGSHDTGVFQINDIHLKKGYTRKDFQNCFTNIKVAKAIFDQQGWGPWSVYKNGSYKKYLR